jgi:hypothetical protein
LHCENALAVEALKIFNERNIDDLIVVNAKARAGRPGGFAGFAEAENHVKTAPFHRPLLLIFMGVAGSGKTTVALFAKKTGATFYEGDEFHPPANIAKMRGVFP